MLICNGHCNNGEGAKLGRILPDCTTENIRRVVQNCHGKWMREGQNDSTRNTQRSLDRQVHRGRSRDLVGRQEGPLGDARVFRKGDMKRDGKCVGVGKEGNSEATG